MAVRKSPFCSLSAALRKLLHPHLRIHAKSNRPSVHSRPSVRTSVRLSSPIIARALHRTRCIFSFGSPRSSPAHPLTLTIDSRQQLFVPEVHLPASRLPAPPQERRNARTCPTDWRTEIYSSGRGDSDAELDSDYVDAADGGCCRESGEL